jgi:hypothetical protein
MIRDPATKIVYASIRGTPAVKMEPTTTADRAKYNPHAYVAMEKKEAQITLGWGAGSFIDATLGIVSEPVFLDYNPETHMIMTEPPVEYVPATAPAALEETGKFRGIKIDESEEITIGNIKLATGIKTPVTLFGVPNSTDAIQPIAVRISDMYVTLNLDSAVDYNEMKTSTSLVAPTDNVQYSLSKTMGISISNSSLFRVIQVTDTVFRLENFFFPGTYLNRSPDGVFFPSILTDTGSELSFILAQSDQPAEDTPEIDQVEGPAMDVPAVPDPVARASFALDSENNLVGRDGTVVLTQMQLLLAVLFVVVVLIM